MENVQLLSDCSAKISRAMGILSVQQPALMIYLGLVEIVPVENPHITMRLSTRRTASEAFIEYNPKFIGAIEEDSIMAFLLYIEGMRLALHHCTQRLQRPAEIHKLASDLICAERRDVLNIGREVVKSILGDLPDFSKYENELKKLGFSKENDFCLEKLIAYFRKLADQKEQEAEQNQGSSKPDDKAGQDGEGAGEETDGESADGNTENQQGETGDYTDMNDALSKHFDHNNREMTAEWGENTSVDEGIRKATEILKNSPELWGNCSAGLRALIEKANEPKYDPSRDLRRFKAVLQSQKVYQSRSKVNKKHPDLCGWRHDMETKILECIDSSGSMSDASVAMGEAFINLFIKHAQTDYCFWDTAMYDIHPRGKKKIKMGEQIDCQGRGGTDPSCIINKLATLKGMKYKYGGLVVFTDCGFNWPDPGAKWRNRILIISTTTKEAAPEWARVRGRVIALKDIIDWNERNA